MKNERGVHHPWKMSIFNPQLLLLQLLR
jgi:hypothetical protein